MTASSFVAFFRRFGTKAPLEPILIGDRYHRVGQPKPTFQVVRAINFPHQPPHVALVSENNDQRMLTIGVSVLQDPEHWVRVG
ncbi:MAG: hypothetical protein WCF85_10460 [Rhodospirillaceae bacterium]